MKNLMLVGAAMSWLLGCSSYETNEKTDVQTGFFEEVVQAGTVMLQNGDQGFCTVGDKCDSGEGDCNNNNQCQTGLVCVLDKGAQFSFAPQVDMCLPATCGDNTQNGDEEGIDCGGACGMCPVCSADPGAGDFCTALCKCDVGEGDCDNDKQCATGLACVADIGQPFGFTRTTDICLAGHCTNGEIDQDETGLDCGGNGCAPCPVHVGDTGEAAYCSKAAPCDNGEGDCDGDIQCVAGTHCELNVGANYGFAAWVDVCEANPIPAIFNVTGEVQTYVVPSGVTSLHVVAKGARGGSNGGLGATVTADISVTPDDVLFIVAGEQGHAPGMGAHPENSAGGGGGSFVYSSTTLYVAAGGGGGRCNYSSAAALHAEAAGQSTEAGGVGSSGGGAGGVGGEGGEGPLYSGSPASGGGAGWISAGTVGTGGGKNEAGGWIGGVGICHGLGATGCGGEGGFGGGGGGGNLYGGGGGGGGYSGGGGGTDPTHGGGGGSYFNGTGSIIGGNNAGDGQVVIVAN